MTIGSFPAKSPTSHLVLAFDFARALTGTEQLDEIVAVQVVVNAGEDPDPASILPGDAVPNIQGTTVAVPVIETRASYKITVIVDTTNPHKRLTLSALLPLLLD